MKPSEIGEAAIAKLKRDGWCQYNLGSDGSPCCLAGAMDYAAPAKPRLGYIGFGRGITSWNDAPGRTAKQVIAVLQQAVDELKVVGQ